MDSRLEQEDHIDRRVQRQALVATSNGVRIVLARSLLGVVAVIGRMDEPLHES